MPAIVKSYRTVTQVPSEAMVAAAHYLQQGWGDRPTLGFVGTWSVDGHGWYVWQCCAGDGSRWLIHSDRFGTVGRFTEAVSREVGMALDVEVS